MYGTRSIHPVSFLFPYLLRIVPEKSLHTPFGISALCSRHLPLVPDDEDPKEAEGAGAPSVGLLGMDGASGSGVEPASADPGHHVDGKLEDMPIGMRRAGTGPEVATRGSKKAEAVIGPVGMLGGGA